LSHYPGHLILGLAALAATLGIRAFTVNRLVRRKLGLSILLTLAYIAVNVGVFWPEAFEQLEERLASVEQLLLALAVLNILVQVTINPLRADRVPDRFPTIVQDAILVGLFLVVSTFVFQEKLLTTSAVGAVVVGFALQDTLGNAFAGLAIQVEKPFRVGHWVSIGSHEGRVAEITWRATKLRTKAGNLVAVPNNVVSKEAITNFSEPAAPTRLSIDVGASYLAAPGEVKEAIREALGNAPRVLKTPAPEALLVEFASSSITYRARFWVADYEHDEVARDEVRTAVYYAFRRRGIEIPWPIQVHYQRREPEANPPEAARDRARLLGAADLFSGIGKEDRERLAGAATDRLYGDGDRIVREGDPGGSVFVIASGRAAVVAGADGPELVTLQAGSYFGEMSLLTGEPRSATVVARGDCRVLEIDAATFRAVAEANPLVLEQVGLAAVARRDALEAARAAAVVPSADGESARSLIRRMKRFLRLP
jgi:small-conductance mechanosensitive channel